MNQFIKHECHMDIAIKLTAPIRRTRTGYIITGKYVNQGFVETFELNIPVQLTISENAIKHWLVCNEPDAVCIRKSTWRPAVYTPLKRKKQ